MQCIDLQQHVVKALMCNDVFMTLQCTASDVNEDDAIQEFSR